MKSAPFIQSYSATVLTEDEKRTLDQALSSFPDVCCSLGACYISLSDFSKDELFALTGDHPVAVSATARDVCERLGVARFFRPPADELVLSTVDNIRGKVERRTVEGILERSERLGHPPSANSLLDKAILEPEKILSGLREYGLEKTEFDQTFRIDRNSCEVRQSIRTSRAEPWYVKLAGLLQPAVKISENLLKTVETLRL